MPTSESPRLPLWKKALFLAIPIVLFLGLMEVVIRFTVPFQNVRALCFHPIMERDYCPGVTGAIKYNTVLNINNDGMIDKEYPVERVPDTIRVAILGDSFTAGEEMAMGKRFHEIWEERLPEKLGKSLEILNFGVRGYGTWEQLQMFHLKAAKYKPDWVIVNFFWGNDIDDNINQLEAGAPNPLEDEYPVDSLWSRLLITRKNFNKWLWNNLALYQWIRTKYNLLEVNIKIWLRTGRQEQQKRIEQAAKTKEATPATSPGSIKPEPNAPAAPQPKPAPAGKQTPPAATTAKTKLDVDQPSNFDDLFFWDSKGWEVTRKLMLKLKSKVEAGGGRLAVIHFPEYNQVHDYPDVPNQEWNAFLKTNGIPYFDTFPLYSKLSKEKMIDTTLVRKHGDHHFSEMGHVTYADFTEQFLEKLLKP
ncbi:MAG: SGNH/GDSL hydrolase family protein [Candidatus Nitronauta litoralis]|uniref:SGNH/GDSL hydrolase family protein n=1 Tax=Candidatus Nitronauta litoralis TaxID=2705533 RepID=A0A7T0G119_9BACT|nr:MAG: SGNH/GDSL hydrolase family protein [Candidatus Nitronauta litoralis]